MNNEFIITIGMRATHETPTYISSDIIDELKSHNLLTTETVTKNNLG